MYGRLLSCLAGAPSCYLELLEKLQKQICRTVGPSTTASLEPLGHFWNVASVSLFYRYYFGKCSSKLAQLVPLPFSQVRSTCHSDRLDNFSVTIPRRYKDVYVMFLSSQSLALQFSAYGMLSFDLKSKWH